MLGVGEFSPRESEKENMSEQANGLASLPVVQRSLSSDAAAERFMQRLASRVVETTTIRDQSDLERWAGFYDRLLELAGAGAALDQEQRAPVLDQGQRMRLLSVFEHVATECEADGIYIFRARFRYWRSNLEHRYISDTLARRLLGLATASHYGTDRDLICELVSATHDVDTCEHCDGSFIGEDLREAVSGDQVCNDCRLGAYTFSSYQDTWIPSDEARRVLLRDGQLDYVQDGHDDFYYHDGVGEWVHVDHEPPRRDVIGSYHSSKPYFVPQADGWTAAHGDRFLGVELEVEAHRVDSEDAAERIHELVNGGDYGRRVFFEHDGSLNSGFEIISQPMSLPAVRELFGELLQPDLVRGLRSHRTSTCGLHVHVSRAGLSNLTIARAVTFVNDSANDAFMQAIARRYETRYCSYREKALDEAHLPGDRYEAVNLTSRQTIEFRMFRGSLKLEAVVAAVEFCHALLEFCARELEPGALNARAFLRWCALDYASETATLRAYVDERTAGLFQHSEAA